LKRKITALTFLSVALMGSNVAIQGLMAIYLGAGSERDALFVAMSIPLFLNTLMIGSFGSVVTPAVVAQTHHAIQRGVATRMLLNLTALAAALTGLLYVFRDGLVQLLVPGFGMVEQAHTASLLGIVLAIIPLQSATCILGGYWIARERVMLPNVAVLSGNLAVIVVLAWSGSMATGVRVAWYYLIGAAITFGVQSFAYLAERRSGPKGVTGLRGRDGHLYRDAMPLLASSLVGRSGPLIERHLASGFNPGTISCLGYVGYLLNFLVNATATPVATVYYARMCRQWNEGRRDELMRFLEKGTILVVLGSLTVAGGTLLAAHDLLRVVQPYTKFSPANMKEMADYAAILMIAYVSMSLASFIARIFYISSQFVRAALLDCATILCYLVLAVPLSRWFGGYGLVAATSVQMVFLVGLIIWGAKHRFGIILPRRLWIGLAKIFGGWIGCLGIGWLVRYQLRLHLPPLAGAIIVGGIYLVSLTIFTTRMLPGIGVDWRQLLPQRRKVAASDL